MSFVAHCVLGATKVITFGGARIPVTAKRAPGCALVLELDNHLFKTHIHCPGRLGWICAEGFLFLELRLPLLLNILVT